MINYKHRAEVEEILEVLHNAGVPAYLMVVARDAVEINQHDWAWIPPHVKVKVQDLINEKILSPTHSPRSVMFYKAVRT